MVTLGFAAVAAAGVTTLLAGGASPASADTITPPQNITLGAYWSGNAGFNTTLPSVYVTSDGGDPIVHLEGAAKQVTPSPTKCICCLAPPGWNQPNLLGVLPAGTRPNRTVYTIAHTMDGTYADLYIDTQGDITMIGAKAPDVTDYSFVSLEGVTFGLNSIGGIDGDIGEVNSDWSATNSYGAAQPGWFETDSSVSGSYVTHLIGAVQQVSSGTNTNDPYPWQQGPNYIGEVGGPALPLHEVHTVVHTLGGTYAELTIDPNCNMFLSGPAAPNFGFVSLEGVTYPDAAWADPSQPLALNTINWSGTPGWYQDPSGVVRLEGEASQVTNYGSGDPALVGTLAQQIRPDRTVFTIAATTNGTYSDVWINPQGQMWLIGARPPAVTNLSTVSLDNISYYP